MKTAVLGPTPPMAKMRGRGMVHAARQDANASSDEDEDDADADADADDDDDDDDEDTLFASAC